MPRQALTVGSKTKQVLHVKDARASMFILKRASLTARAEKRQPCSRGTAASMRPGARLLVPILPWILSGGIYASANLRGANTAKHGTGQACENKQNVFDDFIAAEYLISEGYTDREQASGDGQRRPLSGRRTTRVPTQGSRGVPLLDMVRYHKFLIAYIWASEYGDPDDPEAFRWLYEYSPYHKVRENTEYPAVFFYTAASDSRVDPMHARKMTARLQAVQKVNGPDNPVLLVVEVMQGTGGKPLYKVVREQADMWAFLAWQLGLTIRGMG